MWRMRMRLRHDCLFGSTCVKTGCVCLNVSFNAQKKNGFWHVYHFGTVLGKQYDRYLNILKNDSRVEHLESDGRTFLVIEKRKGREIPGMYTHNELIYVNPVRVEADGWEVWDLAAVTKQALLEFKKAFPEAKLLSIERTKLRDVYVHRLSPALTQAQRSAFDLARSEGYYDFPRGITLRDLAKRSHLSQSGFREHLRRAERKMLGA